MEKRKTLDDLQWMDDIVPDLLGIRNIPGLDEGEYKVWLGNVGVDETVKILRNIIEVLDSNYYPIPYEI